MSVKELQKMAKKQDVKTRGLKKPELITPPYRYKASCKENIVSKTIEWGG